MLGEEIQNFLGGKKKTTGVCVGEEKKINLKSNIPLLFIYFIFWGKPTDPPPRFGETYGLV